MPADDHAKRSAAGVSESTEDVPACWHPRVAFLPLRADQIAMQPPPQREDPPKRTVVCSKCDKPGHNRRSCTEPDSPDREEKRK